MQIHPGHTRLFGASASGDAINFALAAPHAEAVELCLFDTTGQQEFARLTMPGQKDGVWHGAVQAPATVQGNGSAYDWTYGWRVHGPWAPGQGHRFNPAKLLLDPYAREVVGSYGGEDIHLGHDPSSSADRQRPDPRDNARTALKARITRELPRNNLPRPVVDPARRIIYELHVKGFTARHPGVPQALRGSYAGLAHPCAIEHLKQLGITTVCLMPVAHRADEARLLSLGLRNFWGYSPIAWSAPEARYWSGRAGTSPRSEFLELVNSLHEAGLEVVLDAVYNHSAETDEFGPTLSLRGIDNALYYHLDASDPSRYANWTGCGNSVNLNEPLVLRTVMDSLRMWVEDFGVDGFRFDLAPVLARGGPEVQGGFMRHAPLLGAIAQDPVLRERLMIAEPWDIGPGGYQLGAFPAGWLEWNDRYRDAQRTFWLQHQGTRGTLASRIAGSADVFAPQVRSPHSSVNFITAHDGFTLRDLVSYEARYNLDNGEDNRDGHSHNLSNNHGVEGPSDDPAVLARRAGMQRALLAMLMLSLGTPMMLAGDEIGHSQQGNNNAYCQDNATTWLDWDNADAGLLRFSRQLVALRQSSRMLLASQWWAAEVSAAQPAASWFTVNAAPMSPGDWDNTDIQTLALRLAHPSSPMAMLILINAGLEAARFHIPPGHWQLSMDSALDGPTTPELLGAEVTVASGSVRVALSAATSELQTVHT
jgi:glycogen operon protein